MATVKIATCSLCYIAIMNSNFKAVDDFSKDVLDIYLLKLKSEDDSRHVCTTCYETLNSALEFKSMCLINYNRINSYASCERISQLDLRDAYVKENGTAISHNHKVCFLCMQLVQAEFRCVDDEELDAIQKFVPKIDISIVKDPIICTTCFDSLYIHNAFLNNCSELKVKEGICDIPVSENQENAQLNDLLIKTENMEDFERDKMEMAEGFLINCMEQKEKIGDNATTDALSSNLFIKRKTFEKELEVNDTEMPVKPEFIGVKLEDADESNDLRSSLNYEVIENSSIGTVDEKDLLCQKSTGVKMHKCDKCSYETKNKNRFATHYLRHKDALEANKMKNKNLLLIRQARHTNLRMYKCDDCDYETKYKQRYMYHYLAHKNPLDVQMMKCNDCSYETRHRTNFLQHILRHKDNSQVCLYKCNVCSYQSRYKSNVTGHQLRHKSRSEIHLYKCDICSYETRYKANLINHSITHKSPSENRMYQCDQCDYRVKYKSTLKDHKLKHKDPSQVQTYKCNDCVFETIYRKNLMAHVLRHRNLVEDPKYKCNRCAYTTGKKIYLLRHQMKHKSSFQAQMYKCNDCDFETKYKTSITSHVLRHKDISQEEKYKCDKCDYSTMVGGNFQRHQLKHKNPSEIQMYKCDTCCFETKYKRSFVNHKCTHKNYPKVGKQSNDDDPEENKNNVVSDVLRVTITQKIKAILNVAK